MALAAFDLGASQGAAVLGVLERASIPPFPEFYRLLYDYVAGARGLFTARVDTILAEGDARVRLYAEFVAPYDTSEVTAAAIGRINERLQTLDLLLVESAQATAAHSLSLTAAQTGLASGTPTTDLLREWIGQLDAATSRMRRANIRLLDELDEARLELDNTAEELERARQAAQRDPITGLANRAGLDVELSKLLLAQADNGQPLSCAMVDIDHFKSLNDSYGHQVGDEVLRIVARALRISTRNADVVGRTGGDEFLVVLPQADLAQAEQLANRMREAVVDSDLHDVLGSGVLGGMTASIGIAQFRAGDSITRMVERADRALYAAKRLGRNRVVKDGEAA